MNYEQTADELFKRIRALGPQILELESCWKLFDCEGFKCDDLRPSYAQAAYAFSKAKWHLAQSQATQTDET